MPDIELYEPTVLWEPPFSLIRDEMRTVHDLLLGMRQSAQTVVTELTSQRDELAASNQPVLYGDSDIREILIDEYDSWRIEHARESMIALREGAGTMLVFALLERSLRMACETLADESQVKQYLRKDGGRSKINGYLAFLHSRGVAVTEPPDFRYVLEVEKEVRDSFAHGDWALFQLARNDDSATRTLGMLTAYFVALEQAFSQLKGR